MRDAWDVLGPGPLYAGDRPIRVWVVEHELFAGHRALETRPFPGLPGLVWALVEALCVGRSGLGISVDFAMGGSTGWFPSDNVQLAPFNPKESS